MMRPILPPPSPQLAAKLLLGVIFSLVAPAALRLEAKPLFDESLPKARRLELLKAYFTPPPETTLMLDERDLRDHRLSKAATSLRGFVLVSPPRNHCFTITTDLDEPDVRICKPTRLPFTMANLDHAGRLFWDVSTGEGDFGTQLTWHTPYRTALVFPWTGPKPDAPQALPQHEFMQSCTQQPQDDGTRRLEVTLISGKKWLIYFPATDSPEPLPKADSSPSSGDGKDAKKASAPPEKEAPAPASADGKPGAEKTAASGHDQPAAAVVEEVKVDPEAKWHLRPHDAFGMPATNFMPDGSTTPGSKGWCRYSYRGDDVDPKSPRLECHDADQFHMVLMSLPCLQAARD